MAIPTGSLEEDDDGQPIFRAGRDKIFEVDKDETFTPKYITWDGQLMAAFKKLETLLDFLLTTAELPPVALGRDNSGTEPYVRGCGQVSDEFAACQDQP
ncbi:hypothetical protein [Paenibacillus larvae]|uniref:hypothetical protein n=1 Tax=Paenibacillus larvae TaxID=1464 RepID=UPI002891B6E5|nr:hypothetical protein [Paenibacillus larvae]MDT2193392.1 hypothetical protein [Paenibacillus larvae]